MELNLTMSVITFNVDRDFHYYKMEKIEGLRYIGGFGNQATIKAEDFLSAKVDPLADFAAPVMNHMNEDHQDSTIAMIRHYTGVPVSSAEIVALDRLGMEVSSLCILCIK